MQGKKGEKGGGAHGHGHRSFFMMSAHSGALLMTEGHKWPRAARHLPGLSASKSTDACRTSSGTDVAGA